MQKEKRKFDVYMVREYTDIYGIKTQQRVFAGSTWAVSKAKARVNVEYRHRGKALYCGYDLYDMGRDTALEIRYEAEEAS